VLSKEVNQSHIGALFEGVGFGRRPSAFSTRLRAAHARYGERDEGPSEGPQNPRKMPR
jgi:hypothetical protein